MNSLMIIWNQCERTCWQKGLRKILIREFKQWKRQQNDRQNRLEKKKRMNKKKPFEWMIHKRTIYKFRNRCVNGEIDTSLGSIGFYWYSRRDLITCTSNEWHVYCLTASTCSNYRTNRTHTCNTPEIIVSSALLIIICGAIFSLLRFDRFHFFLFSYCSSFHFEMSFNLFWLRSLFFFSCLSLIANFITFLHLNLDFRFDSHVRYWKISFIVAWILSLILLNPIIKYDFEILDEIGNDLLEIEPHWLEKKVSFRQHDS